jgi:hypothetical protein
VRQCFTIVPIGQRKIRLTLGHGTALTGQADGPTLDFAVQKVGVGTKHKRGETKEPGKDGGRGASRAGRGGKATRGGLQLAKVVVDKGAAGGIGVGKVHVGLALDGTLVGFLAELRRFSIVVPAVVAVVVSIIVVVVVVVAVVLVLLVFTLLFGVLAGHTFASGNDRLGRVGKVDTGTRLVDRRVFRGHNTAIVREESEVDGLSVRGTVGTHVVGVPVVLVVSIVVVVVLVVSIVVVVVLVVSIVVVVVIVVEVGLCEATKKKKQKGAVRPRNRPTSKNNATPSIDMFTYPHTPCIGPTRTLPGLRTECTRSYPPR